MKLNRKNSILLIAIVTLFAVLIYLFIIREPASNSESGTSSSPVGSSTIKKTDQAPTVQKESITVTGVVGCLQHVNSDGPQTMECAIGVTTDAGSSYGLQSDDPVMTGSMLTGDRITVEGTLVAGAQQYKSEGVIQVKTLQRL